MRSFCIEARGKWACDVEHTSALAEPQWQCLFTDGVCCFHGHLLICVNAGRDVCSLFAQSCWCLTNKCRRYGKAPHVEASFYWLERNDEKKKKSHFPKCTSHVICHVSLLFFINFKNVDHKVFELKTLYFFFSSLWRTVPASSTIWPFSWSLNPLSPSTSTIPRRRSSHKVRRAHRLAASAPKAAKLRNRYTPHNSVNPPPPKTLLHFLFFFFLCH